MTLDYLISLANKHLPAQVIEYLTSQISRESEASDVSHVPEEKSPEPDTSAIIAIDENGKKHVRVPLNQNGMVSLVIRKT